MDNAFIPGLAEAKGSLPDPAPCPSPCYFLPVGNTWRGPGVCLAQWRAGLLPSSFSKRASFILNVEGNRMEKDSLGPSGVCRN